MIHDPNWLSITTYARVYNADPKTVHKWLDAGHLRFYRIGRFIRIQNLPPSDKALHDTKSVKAESTPSDTKPLQTGQ